MAIQKVNVGQVGNRVNVQVDANKKDVGDKNVKATGIGMLKKMWLHMSGNAGGRHSTQLKNLRTQVKNSFGDHGLQGLNKLLTQKGWGDATTKLFSKRELKSIRQNLDLQAFRKSPMDLISHPKTFAVIEAFAKTEYSTDNTSFLKMMSQLPKDGPGRKVDIDTLVGIYDRFIPRNAPDQINIKSQYFKALTTFRKELEQAIKSKNQNKINTAKDRMFNALTAAKWEITGLIQNDSLGRLKNHKDFGPKFKTAILEAFKEISNKGSFKHVEMSDEDRAMAKKLESEFGRRVNKPVKKVRAQKKPNVKVKQKQVNKEEPVVRPKPVKKMPEPDAPMRPIKADRPLRKAKADNPEPVIRREKAPDPHAKVKAFLGKTPGVKNHPQLKNLTNDELAQINKLVADKKELLAINKAKELLGKKV